MHTVSYTHLDVYKRQTYGCDAATIGVIFDKPASGSRTATAGWYNTAAFEEFAAQDRCV